MRLLTTSSAAGMALAASSVSTTWHSVVSLQVYSSHRVQPLIHSSSSSINNNDGEVTRRHYFGSTLSSIITSAAIVLANPEISPAKVVSKPLLMDAIPASPERDTLIQALSNNSADEVVLTAIKNLVPLNPMKSKSASKYASGLDGEWKLLWYNKSDFSPLLKLPFPLRPDSFQYFGDAAEKEVGSGRVAQGLTGGVVSALGPKKELWLSSGAVAKESDPSILEIFPPFRFQLGEIPGSLSQKQTIVESQSDADFRAVNARTTEAQMAPKNEYEQLYLEDGGSGSLRISVVSAGDPVIVGDMFVHQKL
eukprot:scaffold136414_cov60-Cyclotella_meneghiniana.AAC.2